MVAGIPEHPLGGDRRLTEGLGQAKRRAQAVPATDGYRVALLSTEEELILSAPPWATSRYEVRSRTTRPLV